MQSEQLALVPLIGVLLDRANGTQRSSVHYCIQYTPLSFIVCFFALHFVLQKGCAQLALSLLSTSMRRLRNNVVDNIEKIGRKSYIRQQYEKGIDVALYAALHLSLSHIHTTSHALE